VTAFDLLPVLSLPPGRRPVFGLNEALLENVIQNVFQVHKLVVLEFKLNELGCGRFAGGNAGNKVIGQPEFSMGHFGVKVDEKRSGCK
jgi:hypothetical protein